MARGRKPRAEVLEWERLVTVEKIVAELVDQHHPHLQRAKILVLGKPKARKSGERRVIATGKAVGPELATALKDTDQGEAHYLVIVGRDCFNALTQDQKRIEIDRALCGFAGQDEKGRWLLQDYDIKDYRRMLDWYGLKHSVDADLYGQVVKGQLDLLGEGPVPA